MILEKHGMNSQASLVIQGESQNVRQAGNKIMPIMHSSENVDLLSLQPQVL